MDIHHIQLDEVESTNTYLKALIFDDPELPSWTAVSTAKQSQGRGQRGNSWESEPYKNITLSVLLRPETYEGFEPFDLNVFVSLGVCAFLREYLPSQHIKIKWPNDIYVGEKKIAGILTENEWLNGRLTGSIVGIGVNINQIEFVSDAPNPTSITLETGKEYPLSQLTDRLLAHLQQIYGRLSSDIIGLREAYHKCLFRMDGIPHTFIDMEGIAFDAILVGVAPTGLLQLRPINGDTTIRQYAFKEVAFVL